MTVATDAILAERAARVTRELLDIAGRLSVAVRDFGMLSSAVECLADEDDDAFEALDEQTGTAEARSVLCHVGALVEGQFGGTDFRPLESEQLSALIRKYESPGPLS